jgi:glycogen debranching enzyme
MGEKMPQLLRSTVQSDNAFLTLDMMNPDVYRDGRLFVPRGSVHLFRSKFLWQDVCYDKLRLANFHSYPIETSISLEFAADYADIFQVRGTKREHIGEMLPANVEEDRVVLSYRGRDRKMRCTRLDFSPVPQRLSDRSVTFAVALNPKEECAISITTTCDEESENRTIMDFGSAMDQALSTLEQDRHQFCGIITSDIRFNTWLSRSEADVHMMISGNPEGAYPYAGVPWFSTVFGRDGIITAMECIWAAPSIAKSVLKFLAENQATSVIAEEDAEPGKILHEMRHGEMANLKEIPFGRYYGSVDSTPLFVMLAGEYFEYSRDEEFIKEIWPNILAALDWADHFGDADKDGFVEYQRKSETGLTQQGWKDSYDSVFYSNGVLANPPIALCEVQAYVYGAKKAAARIAAYLGFTDLADVLERKAGRLQEQFEREFWDDELSCYVLALDGQKQRCRVRSSNAGHCLWTGIASAEHAAQLAKTLLHEDSFCGWGIRTLASGEVRYNPMSYHNGSVWPHDNAIIASGLARYGYKHEALRILAALFDAGTFMEFNRLPELFCGFHKRSEVEGPTLYPVACSPQAWAAASPYMLFQSCLGLSVKPADNTVEFTLPCLPESISQMELTNLRVGEDTAHLRISRDQEEVRVEVVRASGDVRVKVRK